MSKARSSLAVMLIAVSVLLIGFANGVTPAIGAMRCPAPSYPLLGANYAHYLVRAPAGTCRDEQPPLQHLTNAGLVANYDAPGVRAAVVKQLAEMRAGALSALRILIWHRTDIGPERWGIVSSAGGRLSPRDAANLRNFVTDVARAGFRRLTIALAPQQANSPKCTRKTARDCIDEAKFAGDISFALNVAEVAKQTPRGALQLRFDLMNEGCVPARRPRSEILRGYLVSALRAYAAKFGTTDVTVSCFSDTSTADNRWFLRMQMLVSVFREAGFNPQTLDFHLYDAEPQQIETMLSALRQLLAPSRTRLVIGESLYDNQAQARAIAAFAATYPAFIEEVDTWPVTHLSPCRITVPPPYDACPLAAAFTQRDRR